VNADKIYLVGYMAVGKSTVARALAPRLGWEMHDIDDLVEVRERRTIGDIFAREGEQYFRTIEREMLRLIAPLRRSVIATGGGTFADSENRQSINADGLSVWLDVPFDEVLTRLPADPRRPLSGDRAAMERLYLARRPAYQQAHVRIDAYGRPVPAIVEEIVAVLEGLPADGLIVD